MDQRIWKFNCSAVVEPHNVTEAKNVCLQSKSCMLLLNYFKRYVYCFDGKHSQFSVSVTLSGIYHSVGSS